MNELESKKLGELLAFAIIGEELLARAGQTADKAFGPVTAEMRSAFAGQKARIEKYSNPVSAAKAARTVTKLRTMMELYVGDEWDNPTELLEWSGFYLGSAYVHWSLMSGLAADEDLKAFARQQAGRFSSWLTLAGSRIAAR